MRFGSVVRAGLAGGIALLCVAGCASLEVAPAKDIPEVRVVPPAAQEEHASPPPLQTPPVSKEEVKAPPAAQEPLTLTVEAAIAMALENNQSLKAEKVDSAMTRTYVAEQKAVFDPTLAGAFTRTRQHIERDLSVVRTLTVQPLAGGAEPITVGRVTTDEDTSTTTDTVSGSVGITEYLPTGTTLSLSVTPSSTHVDYDASRWSLRGTDTDADGTTAQLSVTQKLLKGAGLGVNLASVRQAKLAVLSSDYQLRSFVESLVAQVESVYWDYCLARRRIKILEDSLAVAEAQAAEIEERIRVGTVAESERAAAEAEVAQRKSSLIDGHSSLDQLRLALLQLLNPSEGALRNQEINLVSEPIMPDIPLDEVEYSLELARRMRPELNQARLLIEQDKLEVLKTKNGLLPQLDVFATLLKDVNRTEYSELIQTSTRDLEDDSHRIDVGLEFSYPLGNRAARARLQRAHLSRERDMESLANLLQTVEQDVRGAYVELSRAKEQVAATAATLRLQEVVAQTETEKFRVGKSTSLLVAQAQRDLLSAQIGEAQAVKNFLQAIVDLYRLDGTLLLRRGIECPGSEGVKLDGEPAKKAS